MAATLACCVLWQSAGCRKPAGTGPAVVVEHAIDPWPARVGSATFTLRLSDPSGAPIPRAHISLEADMTHPGMRPEFGETREISAGRYQGRLNFTMPGDWIVILHITLPGGHQLERQLEVHGVR